MSDKESKNSHSESDSDSSSGSDSSSDSGSHSGSSGSASESSSSSEGSSHSSHSSKDNNSKASKASKNSQGSKNSKNSKASKGSENSEGSESSDSSEGSHSSESSSEASRNSKDNGNESSGISGSSSSDDSDDSSSSSEEGSNDSSNHSEEDESSDDSFDEETAVPPMEEGPYAPNKDWFSELPEPQVSKYARILTNPYVTQIQSAIKDLSDHVKLIQKEELSLINTFTGDMESFTDEVGNDDEEERKRLEFLDNLYKVREKRKRFRGLLYDAIKERNSYLRSHEIQQATEKEKEEQMKNLGPKKGSDMFAFLLIAMQAAVIILFLIFFDYSVARELTIENLGWPLRVENHYSMYIGLSFIVFLGFGFFGAQYRYFGFSSIGQTFILAALALQWAVVIQGLLTYIPDEKFYKIGLTLPHLIEGLYAAAAVVISSGVVLGQLNVRQLTLMTLFQVPIYCFNWMVALRYFNAYDTGYSMLVHVFGAVFGWAVYLTVKLPLKESNKVKGQFETSSYNSEIFSWIGVLFLWVFWPSFNATLAPHGTQFYAVINSVFALLASCITAFAFMHSTNYFRGDVFVSDVIRHASIAGGLFVSSSVSLMIEPYIAILLGFIAGIAVVFTQFYLRPFVERESGLKDTMGVLYLHGLVGLLAAIGGMIAVGVGEDQATKEGRTVFGIPFEQIFFNRVEDQFLYQLATLATSLGFAIVGGILTGFAIRSFHKFRSTNEPDFNDHRDFLVTGDFPVFVTRDPREPGAAAVAN